MLFPVWSDLGEITPSQRNTWEGEFALRQKYRSYYTGDVFKTKVPDESGTSEDSPELYPVGVNIVKMMSLAIADSIFGEWDEDIVRFEPRQDSEITASELEGMKLANLILSQSAAPNLLWEMALDREIYGGAPIKISPDFGSLGRIKLSRVPLDSFYPIWDPDDPDKLLELYIVIEMTKEQAKAKYGYDGSKDIIQRIEHWTLTKYETLIDKHPVNQFSGFNPWGMIPYEYIPRLRSTHWWGDSLTEELIRPQDEINMRLADLGDAINYNAQPTRYGYNLPKTFNTDNYPVGPNMFWDLGRVLGASPPPFVGVLESKNPIPQGTFDYVNFLYDWSRTSAFAPPIAFGEDDGGGQRSGITLEIRMMPLVKSIRRSRSYLASGLVRAMKKAAIILGQKDFADIPKMGVRKLAHGALVPRFAPLLPRDQAAVTDMVVKLLSTTPPTISIETAVKVLGFGTSEIDRIMGMLVQDKLYQRAQSAFGTTGINSGSGNAPG